MPLNTYFTIFEALIILLFGFSLRHAFKTGPAQVFQLFAGVLFGIILELATIQQLHAYSYGKFFLMIGNVPLAIGIGWGIIIYSVRLVSDQSNLPFMIRPFLDGLLALNIDLTMDAIAIRLGMWNWGEKLQYQYFGVPYANFWAWFWVVFFYSAGIRVLTHLLYKNPKQIQGRSSLKIDFLIALAGLFIGLFGVLATNAFIAYVVPERVRTVIIAVTLISALILILFFRPKFSDHGADSIAFWVPLGFHLYFLVIGIVSKVIFTPLFLLFMGLMMLVLSIYLHKRYLLRVVSRKRYRSESL